MITVIRKSLYQHAYLLIAAAWLYTISFLAINYWNYNTAENRVQDKLQKKLHAFESFMDQQIHNEQELKALVANTSDISTKQALLNQPYGLFIYELNQQGAGAQLVFWNNSSFYINYEEIAHRNGIFFTTHQNGSFVIRRNEKRIDQKTLVIIGVLPVRWDYFIENKYLRAGFDGLPDLEGLFDVSLSATGLPVKTKTGSTVYYVQQKERQAVVPYDNLTLLLRTLALVLLLISINLIASDIVKEVSFQRGFLVLAIAALLFRWLLYPRNNIFFSLNRVPLFDPSIYASSAIHPSLGDLLINAILMYWIIGFYRTGFFNKDWQFGRYRKVFPIVSLVLLTLCAFSMTRVINSLVIDSKISFDVDNFFSLDQYTLIGFLILCFLVLAFSRLSKILLRPIIETATVFPKASLVIAITGLLWISVFRQQVLIDILITIWMIGYTGMFYAFRQDLYTTLPKSPNFILRVLIFAASVAGIVMYQNRQVEFAQRKQNAYRLSIQSDPSGEHLLSLAAANFNPKFLSEQFYRFTTEYSSRYLKDSLTAENFSGYLNKYDSRIYVYDSLYKPLYNDDSTSYGELKSMLINQARKTDIDNLYVFTKDNRQHFIYAQTIPGLTGQSEQGYLFVLVNPKRYKSEALYPELFTQAQNLAADLNTSDAYAVYSNGRLLNHFGDYAFPSEISTRPAAYYEYKEIVNGSYNELWYNAGNQKQVVIVKKRDWLIEFFTLIAYIFCSFLLIMFLFRAGGFLLQKRLNLKPRELLNQLTIRTQVHTTIIFLSIFSFIIIGIVTISFFIIRFNQGNQERLSRAIQVMSNEIANKVEAELQFDDIITLNDQGFNVALEKTIAEISDIHNVEVNFFDTTGSLKVSTQPYVYNKHLLNEKMDPKAYLQLHNMKQIRFVQEERVGGFKYLSIYVPVNDASGKPYAYLNIPYFNSQSELNQEISGFLATLINLNAFIFLIAGSLAFFLTNRITASFQFIANKMRAIALGKDNEAIAWNRQDEIGLLVNEYNRMLGKLEESATALARNEREGAWREMARQVAHEIKNPLTPMKLSIQYLKQSIDSNAPNVQELSNRVTQTLVDQIDQLSRIAGDFSQFANIGNSKPELIVVDTAIEATLELYRTNQKLQIQLNAAEPGLQVSIDKLQFNRLLTNLLQNVVEAGEQQDSVEIQLTIKREGGWVLITIEDNCGGIPESLRQRIFTPNFTTKTSGTGLGLAICRGIAEQAGGAILLKHSDSKGSVFQLQLPLAHH